MKWSPDKDEFLRRNYGKCYAANLAVKLRVTPHAVRVRAFRLGLTNKKGGHEENPIAKGYRGVSRVGNRWQSRFRGQHLGCYLTQDEAALAYNEAASAALGEKAHLNDVGEGAGG